MTRSPIALLLALLVAACAPLKPAPEKRYDAAELLALRPATFVATAASRDGERRQREAARARIDAVLAQPAGPARDAALPALFDDAALFNTGLDAVRPLLLAALPGLGERDPETQRALLTAAHAHHASAAAPLLWPLLPRLANSKPFAIAAYTLLQADAAAAAQLRAATTAQFPRWADDARLTALVQALDRRLQPVPPIAPPLADLLAAPLRAGYPVVFSLQRPGRRQMGLALVRGADGRFVAGADGRPFASPQLALALTGLPGTITNGNTPQGVFTIVGAGTATNAWIGPTPYLHSKLPVEASPAEFEHAPTAVADWSPALYDSYLPPSWRGWAPIKEAWLAGLAGRDEILLHGTVVDPDYYRGASFFPGTPSAGCLVSNEDWDPATGRLRGSRQLALAQAFAAAGGGRGAVEGYLVVVEVGAGNGPVTLDEVLPALPEAPM